MVDWDKMLLAADDKVTEANAKALFVLKAALPPGRRVTWMHGDYERFGEVVEVRGFQYRTAGVVVKSVTGLTYEVPASSIVVHIRGG